MNHKLKIEWSHYEPESDKCGSTGALAYLDGEYIFGVEAKELYEKDLEDVSLESILYCTLGNMGVRIIDDSYTGSNLKDDGVRHTLEVEWSEDSYDCDDCGVSFSTGATVHLDGIKIVAKEAHAHCYSGSGDVDLCGILLIALEKLGVEVEDDESDLQWSKDTCYDWDLGSQGEINFIKL